MPVPADVASDNLSLDHAIGELDAVIAHVKDTLASSASMLGAVYQEVLLAGVVPSTA